MTAVTLRPAWLAIGFVLVAACGGAPPQTTTPRRASLAVLEERWATERPADWEPIAAPTFRRALEGARVELIAGRRLTLAIESAPEACDEDVECLRRVARSLAADQLVATTLAELGGTVLVRVRVVSTDEGASDAMQQAVVRDAGPEATADALFAIGSELAAPFRPEPEIEESAWYESPWLWAGAGTTVVLGAVVIVLVATQGGSNADYVISP
jgi:hypothetical protein